jgi:enamine deaminase RidA (YjgF/YER057c/UK114 family)
VEGGIKPIGPYTVGKIVDARANILYLSGNIGLDPKV